jgi:hypothetical protein
MRRGLKPSVSRTPQNELKRVCSPTRSINNQLFRQHDHNLIYQYAADAQWLSAQGDTVRGYKLSQEPAGWSATSIS